MSQRSSRIPDWARIAIFVVLCAGLGYSGAAIIDYFVSGTRDINIVEDARTVYYEAAEEPLETAEVPLPSGQAGQPGPDEQDTRAMQAYERLMEMNPDAVGWLSIPETEVDYPVAQTDNNRYYLNHNFKKQKSAHACIFLDWRNEPGDMSFVIYGHNMKDGTFFGSLTDFRDEQYCRQHSVIDVNMWGEATKWQIFSVHLADDTAVPTMFGSFEEYGAYIETIRKASDFDLGVEVNDKDTILTLSTCDNGNSRLLVHAVRVK